MADWARGALLTNGASGFMHVIKQYQYTPRILTKCSFLKIARGCRVSQMSQYWTIQAGLEQNREEFSLANVWMLRFMDVWTCVVCVCEPRLQETFSPLWQDHEKQSYSTLKSKGTNAKISGLKPATSYIFQIRARTSAGCGRFSPAVEIRTGKVGKWL